MTKLFKNGISLKWFLLLIGIVAGSGITFASVNPTISDQTSIFNGINVTSFNSSGVARFATDVYVGAITTINYISTPSGNDMVLLSGGSEQLRLKALGGVVALGVSSNTGESACWVAASKELVRNAGVSNTCAPSAEKYKNVHGTFNDSTISNKFAQLHPIIFDYKSDVKHLEKFGFNANEIALQYPQIVTTHYEGNGTFVNLILNTSNPNKADGILYSDGTTASIEGINYEMLYAVLVNQVQDQQFQLDTQSAEIRKICTNNPLLCS